MSRGPKAGTDERVSPFSNGVRVEWRGQRIEALPKSKWSISGQTRLTSDAGIDTEASWSPDGQTIVFTSDRGGSPQIYRVSPAGGPQQRVTFNMGDYNARASYAPDGKSLVMVHGDGGFRIAVLTLDDGQFRVITNASLDESPSFAPNGSMIIYATMGGRGTELAATSVDGTVKQRLALQQGQVREPAWGPFRE